jgi:hypothetical protein
MALENHRFYPSEDATPRQLLVLADAYGSAADAVLANCRKGEPLSRAPFRFLTIHAIELYLNALLLASGETPAKLRGMQHDLAARGRLPCSMKLGLKQRTQKHIEGLSDSREYLTARYDPHGPGRSEITRLAATLAEVAKKVTCQIESLDRKSAEQTNTGARYSPIGAIEAKNALPEMAKEVGSDA